MLSDRRSIRRFGQNDTVDESNLVGHSKALNYLEIENDSIMDRIKEDIKSYDEFNLKLIRDCNLKKEILIQ